MLIGNTHTVHCKFGLDSCSFIGWKNNKEPNNIHQLIIPLQRQYSSISNQLPARRTTNHHKVEDTASMQKRKITIHQIKKSKYIDDANEITNHYYSELI